VVVVDAGFVVVVVEGSRTSPGSEFGGCDCIVDRVSGCASDPCDAGIISDLGVHETKRSVAAAATRTLRISWIVDCSLKYASSGSCSMCHGIVSG
jgi:hypothetical protein